jgi:hypothetical protein
MSWLGVWLVGIGLMDLVRAVEHPVARRLAPALGALVVIGLGLLAGLTTAADLLALVLSLVPLLAWWYWSRRALEVGGRNHVWALSALVGGALALLAFSGSASLAGGLFRTWQEGVQLGLVQRPTGRLLLVTGLLLVNLATGNLLVRLVLVAVGALRPTATHALTPQPADRLKGGRLLGPMERWFILGLGLAGQLTAAAVVVAAKGLIRFPELQSKSKDGRTEVSGAGIDELTEYFLVGSFLSWLVALGSLALTR